MKRWPSQKVYVGNLKRAVKALKINPAARSIIVRIGIECWMAWRDHVASVEKDVKALKETNAALAKAARILRKRLDVYEALDPFKDVDTKKK